MSADPAADAAMSRYACGDAAAFAEVYDALAPRLFRYLDRRTGNRALTEDLVQQTFLRIHLYRGRFQAGAEVLPWAYSIAHRLLIDAWRRNGRPPPDSRDDSSPCPDAVLQARRLARHIEAELDRMPESQRCAFEMIKLEGLSLREAAEALGVTVTAVKLRAHRAYAALRLAIGDVSELESG